MSKIEILFIRQLVEFYGKNPYGDLFTKRLERDAEGLSDEAIAAAADRLIETGGRTFPNLAKCREALRSAKSRDAGHSTETRSWDIKAIDKAAWLARKDAVRICQASPLAREAARDGWIVALLDFVTDSGRLPDGHEAARCKHAAERSQSALEALRGNELYRSLLDMRVAMLRRAELDVFGNPEPFETPDIR